MRHLNTITRPDVKGQVLLVALMVLGFVAIGFVMISNISLIKSAKTATVLENKALAAAAATACIEQAMTRLAMDVAYAGNVTSTIGTQTCHIQPITSGGGTWTINTVAQVGNQYSRYRTILSGRSPIIVSSWAELSN